MKKTILSFLFLLSVSANARDGALDSSFGTDGKVTTDFGGATDQAFAALLQPDGKIVAAGGGSSIDFALARYNTNGSLDTSFGTDGKVTTDFSGGTDLALAVLLQPDGKIVAAGQAAISSTDFALARYNTNGSLDTSFGTDGKVTTDFFGSSDKVRSVLLQPDGKIVAAGESFTSGFNSDFAIARYNANGTLDSSFGTDGKVNTNFEGQFDRAFAVLLQPDGKIVAAGETGSGDFALARYNTDGTLDTSFGTDGKVITDFFGNSDRAYAVLLQPDGKIVAVGRADGPVYDFAVARYNTDGSLDTSFGTDGKVTTDFVVGEDEQAFAALLQPDGKIVAAGWASDAGDFILARYNTNGSLDTSFGTDGKLTTDFFGALDIAWAVNVQPDGKIVVAGQARSSSTDFALARYLIPSLEISSFARDLRAKYFLLQ